MLGTLADFLARTGLTMKRRTEAAENLLQVNEPVLLVFFSKGLTDGDNVIAVVANNDILNLYVDHQHINTQQDSTFCSGQIAVVAENVNSPTEVVFRNVKVWQF